MNPNFLLKKAYKTNIIKIENRKYSTLKNNKNCIIIGSGIVGLSIAFELALSQRNVQEREKLNIFVIDEKLKNHKSKASLIGAGICSPESTFLKHYLNYNNSLLKKGGEEEEENIKNIEQNL